MRARKGPFVSAAEEILSFFSLTVDTDGRPMYS